MSFGFVQQMMLLGLAGIALPVIAHLLSKRKFDVVFWGAMQFLELGRRTRRRIRLEELLLLLLRIGVISLLVFAFARPWGKGGLLAQMSDSVRRDVVFVIDGSYSMGWEGGATTPHAAARQWAHKALGSLKSTDTISLLEARDHVLPVIESPTSDVRTIRTALDELSPPGGSSRIAAAATRAVQLLSQTTNPVREVVILTDGQAYPWSAGDPSLWARFDDLRSQQSVQPRVWAVDVSEKAAGPRTNFSVDRIELSRPMTVPGFPLRIRTTIRQSGGAAARRSCWLAVNGQRLQETTTIVNLPPNGEAPVEFEHRFPSAGSQLVTVAIEADDLPGDNEAHAAVVVSAAAPVLLVDGRPHLDAVRSKSFFVQSALSPSGNESPWIRAKVLAATALSAGSLEGNAVVMLLDVASLDPPQVEALVAFVKQGGGLVVAAGPQANSQFYNTALFQEGRGLLPAELVKLRHEADTAEGPILLDGDSFEAPWMSRFKPGRGVDLAGTRLSTWWTLKPAAFQTDDADPDTLEKRAETTIGQPLIAARLKGDEPWVVTRRFGEGQVAELAIPLDSEWSTLPTKSDFVPFLHELVFSLVSLGGSRNVEVGMPLAFPLPDGAPIENLAFLAPDGRELPARRGGDDRHPLVRLDAADAPGVYRAVRKSRPHDAPEYFVVEFDRHEADLTPLAPDEIRQLGGDDRIRFIQTVEELNAGALADVPRSELWWLLLLGVLVLLVVEVAMTRRLVRGGHEFIDPDETGQDFAGHDSPLPGEPVAQGRV